MHIAQNRETREHNTVFISTFLYTRNLYSYTHLEIFICIYSEIDQISTNAFRCTTCCAANVYMFVYILIGAPIVPLTWQDTRCPWKFVTGAFSVNTSNL